MFPDASVAVIVTVTDPASEQSNVLGETLTVMFASGVQLSTTSLTTSLVVIEASPFASRATTTGSASTVI